MADFGIILTIKNSYSYCSKHFNSLDQRLQNKLIKEISYQKKNRFGSYTEIYLFVKKSKNQTNEFYYQFPTGLIYTIINFFRANNIYFKLNDLRGIKSPQVPISEFYEKLKLISPEIEEREYQLDALEKALKRGRGIVNHSTASGKTLIIAGIIYSINVKTLVLCIGKTHIDQMQRDLEKYTGRVVTKITGGTCNDNGPIVVANLQALNAIMKKNIDKYKLIMASFKCVMIDECHHTSCISAKTPMYYCINAYYKFGFSGTVYREDGAMMEIIAATGPVLSKVDYTDLTKGNYISSARFLIIDPMCDLLLENDNVWPDCLYKGIVDNNKRNIVISKICNSYNKRNKQVLVLTPLRTQHGKILESIIPNSRYLFGESSAYYRTGILHEFANKEFNILIASNIFDEIINLPDLQAVILAGGGKAHNAVYQRIGRGIRKAEGKSFVDIVILWDSHSSVLLKHSKRIVSLIKKIDVWKHNVKFIGKHRYEYNA